jgi:Response regulators consisting of a CheY-like receiver domain and a winged-helix DNA-binding domain
MTILLIEDNPTITRGLEYAFQKNGFCMDSAYRIQEADAYLKTNRPDLVILDISLPDGNGLDLYTREIKSMHIPTIILTAKDTEDDIVAGLELGADDYITKPFSTRELIARVNRILSKDQHYQVTVRNITFDFDKMEIYKEGQVILLTSLELKVLSLLFSNMNKVVSRSTLIESIWQWTGNDVNENTVTVYLKRIREKLGEDIIITVKGIGYRIDEDK